MAFCINCGITLPDGSKFCPSCGTPQPVLEPIAPAPEPIVPVPEPIVFAPEPEFETEAETEVEPEIETEAEFEPEVIEEAVEEDMSEFEEIELDQPDISRQKAPIREVRAEKTPARLSSPIMQADYDMESGEEPAPVVGTYSIPAGGVSAPGRAGKTSAKDSKGKQSVRSPIKPTRHKKKKRVSRVPVIIGIVCGAAVLLAAIITGAVLIFKNVSGSGAPSGDGTALVEIVDNAAYNSQMGY